MGDWDAVFDETYLQTYVPMTSDERSREQALAAVALARSSQVREAGFADAEAFGPGTA